MKKVFIFGYYGFKNIGDEAILAAIVKTLRDIDVSIDISALSYNVKYTEEMHSIRGISRNNMKEIIETIKSCDIVISGGGSLLQDVTSNRSIIYYLGLIYIAKLYKKQVMFFSNGFGPVKKQWNKYLVRKIVNKVDKIILRDLDSRKAMKSIGIKGNIDVTTDATYILKGISKERLDNILINENIKRDKPLIGISVRPWNFGRDFIKIMARFADYVTERGYNVVFIPMQVTKDAELSKKIRDSMKNQSYIIEKEYRPEELLSIVGEVDALVGMRLHSLIFASIKGIPMIGIEYDPKIKSFLEITDQKNIGKADKLDLGKLCMEFDRLMDNRQTEANRVKEISKTLKDKTRLNKSILLKMIK